MLNTWGIQENVLPQSKWMKKKIVKLYILVFQSFITLRGNCLLCTPQYENTAVSHPGLPVPSSTATTRPAGVACIKPSSSHNSAYFRLLNIWEDTYVSPLDKKRKVDRKALNRNIRRSEKNQQEEREGKRREGENTHFWAQFSTWFEYWLHH